MELPYSVHVCTSVCMCVSVSTETKPDHSTGKSPALRWRKVLHSSPEALWVSRVAEAAETDALTGGQSGVWGVSKPLWGSCGTMCSPTPLWLPQCAGNFRLSLSCRNISSIPAFRSCGLLCSRVFLVLSYVKTPVLLDQDPLGWIQQKWAQFPWSCFQRRLHLLPPGLDFSAVLFFFWKNHSAYQIPLQNVR